MQRCIFLRVKAEMDFTQTEGEYGWYIILCVRESGRRSRMAETDITDVEV